MGAIVHPHLDKDAMNNDKYTTDITPRNPVLYQSRLMTAFLEGDPDRDDVVRRCERRIDRVGEAMPLCARQGASTAPPPPPEDALML